MWWKITIAVISALYVISPIDLSSMNVASPDDLIALLSMAGSIAAAVRQVKRAADPSTPKSIEDIDIKY